MNKNCFPQAKEEEEDEEKNRYRIQKNNNMCIYII